MSNILVVDDERSIRDTFKIFLSREGHNVQTAENVELAEEILKENELDLVFTDILMPKFTGMDLLKRFKDYNPDIPIIIMTGEPSVETASLAVKGDAYDYAVKPVRREQLLTMAKKALEFKSAIDDKKKLEIENREYRDHLQDLVDIRTSALQKAMQGTIATISSILEMRDPYTAGHEVKVGNLAVAIATKMGLSRLQIDSLYIAGYLHDIGKISIPTEILSKPGKLTGMELAIVKEHINYGYNLLKKVELPGQVATIVHQHHERLDGSGYPQGLKGDEIIIESRIMNVADVLEAMASHRPYRPGLGIRVALNEIKQNAGILYDQEVCDIAVDLFENDGYEFNSEAQAMNLII